MKKFYLKLSLYILIIGLTAFHSHNNFVKLHELLYFQEFEPIKYTQYLLNFVIGLFMVFLEFEILKTDNKFLSKCEIEFKKLIQ